MESLLSSLPLLALSIELLVAGVVWRLSRTPGWAHLRSFVFVALTAAAFTASTFWLGRPEPPDEAIVWAARCAQAAAAWHVAAWLHHTFSRAGDGARRRLRLAVGALLAVSLVPLLPGATLAAPVWALQLAGPAHPFRMPTILPAGAAFSVAVPSLLLVPLVAYVRRWRRGDVEARAYVVGLGCFVVGAATEVAFPLARIEAPVLGDVGFIAVVVAVLANVLRQLSADAARLEALTVRLKAEVEERSRELESAWGLLASTERLAALGELSAKVAHEVNNPLAWLASNLRFVEERCRGDEELREAVADAIEGSHRIAEVIARLGAQAAESARAAPESLDFKALFRTAVEVVRTQGHAGLAVVLSGEVGLRFGDRAQVLRLLVELVLVLAQAARAAGAGASLSARLAVDDDAVHLALEGPGAPGKDAGALDAHALVVARALVRSLRGTLELPAGPVPRLDVQLPLPPFDPSGAAAAA